MKPIALTLVSAVFVLAFMTQPFAAVIEGTVIDSATGKPVAGAKVSVRAALTVISSESGESGRFVLKDIPEGRGFVVRAEKYGFRSGHVSADVPQEKGTAVTIELCSRYLELLRPNGGEAIFAGSWEIIRWNSAGVDTITIEYSIDSGRKWTVLASEFPAEKGRYVWDVDDIPSPNYRIRLRDSRDPGLSDESEADFGTTSI